jgi:peptidoglycan hydrolase CwlO-like protein
MLLEEKRLGQERLITIQEDLRQSREELRTSEDKLSELKTEQETMAKSLEAETLKRKRLELELEECEMLLAGSKVREKNREEEVDKIRDIGAKRRRLE